MIGIDWTMADWKTLLNATPLQFKESILNDSNFFGLSLEDTIFEDCEVREVDLSTALLKRSNFKGSDLKGSIFHHTHLEGVNFLNTTNISMNPKTNHLEGAIFSRYEALFLLESMGIVLVD